MKKVKKEFIVWLKESFDGHYEGSSMYVNKESKFFYYGIHASHGGSFQAKYPKKICTKTNPMDRLLKVVYKKKLNSF